MTVTRFAPSPTGYLHLGHAYAAIVARENGSRFLLRIEDLDQSRAREEFVDAIFEDLHWLGLAWPQPVLRQSQRTQAYTNALETLAAENLTYPCFCTRKEIADELPFWGGVVPVRTVFGEPQSDATATTNGTAVPEHVRRR